MSKTIEFGAFINSANEDRLSQAQRVARDLGVTLSSDGSPFAGSGPAAPVKVVVALPQGTTVTPEDVKTGRDALDAILTDGERLTDYALVKDDGVLTSVVSLLTAGVQSVPRAASPAVRQGSADAAPTPARPRRWSPFSR